MKTRQCGCTTPTCGCCAGTEPLTPAAITNRPGLDALAYRIGTHGSFLATMKARLGTMTVQLPDADGQPGARLRPLANLTRRDGGDPAIALLDGWATVGDVLTFYQERFANEAYLRTATERRSVLELARLVGYALRPGVAATTWLAYTLDENQKTPVEIPAGARSQSIPGPDELPQSFETAEPLLARREWNDLGVRRTAPQKITADNVKMLDALYFVGTETGLKANDPLLFRGLGGSDTVRTVASVEPDYEAKRTRVTLVAAAAQQAAPAPAAMAAVASQASADSPLTLLRRLAKPLSRPPALPVARSSTALQRSLRDALGADSDVQAQLLGAFNPVMQATMYGAWANGAQMAASSVSVLAFGVRATPFGSNAPLKPRLVEGTIVDYDEWPVAGDAQIRLELNNLGSASESWFIVVSGISNGRAFQSENTPLEKATRIVLHDGQAEIGRARLEGSLDGGLRLLCRFDDELLQEITFRRLDGGKLEAATSGLYMQATVGASGDEIKPVSDTATNILQVEYRDAKKMVIQTWVANSRLMPLDAAYEQVLPGSTALVLRGNREPLVTQVDGVATATRSEYLMTGKSTRLTLAEAWRDAASEGTLAAMRNATVYADSRVLELAEAPLTSEVDKDVIELARLCDGLKSGRWIIVAGERADVVTGDKAVAGVMAAELVMLGGIRQTYDADLPGDKVHSVLQLANPLAYRYKRETVKIYGNVVKASHGETRQETLGNGDGARSLQSFALKQPPLTFVAAETPSGVASTLQVLVNDIAWHEDETLALHGPRDRAFVSRSGDDGVTTVIFGNGEQGARLPTGVENVKAIYRNGIGKPGNVKAGQISLLQTRPLGVKEVTNPLPATGGADRESRDLARESAPLAVMSLDRLVSVQDYADFARSFAGIGKAAAWRLSNGHRQVVHVTIAGVDDIPIAPSSDLYLNLVAALRKYGDPALPVQVVLRELVVLLLSANVRLLPDYRWDAVAPRIRQRLLDTFGFARQGLAQSVCLGQVVGLIQNIEGVAYVDVDTFGGLPEKVSYVDGSRHLPSQEAVRQWLTRSGRTLRPFAATNRQLAGTRRVEKPGDWVEARAAGYDKGTLYPAQLAVFLPAVPDTLILNQIG